MQRVNNQAEAIVEDKKTIEWLVDNTEVSVFNPVTLEGYQRKISDSHCQKIVDYLENNIFMPVAIICACDETYTESMKLRIVDGQHRVNAFKIIKNNNPSRYEEIKKAEMPVIVLEKVSKAKEIETFITINKTSKKVDTSLAYILKNKLAGNNPEAIETKVEYLAVMAAIELNEDSESLWFNKIIYEGLPKEFPDKYITINAFVGASKPFINILIRKKVITTDWKTAEDADKAVNAVKDEISTVWRIVRDKWADLKEDDLKVLHSAIGFTAINRVTVELLKESKSENTIESLISDGIGRITIGCEKWKSGGEYSKYSSAAGHRLIANELISSMKDK